jgi:hypothetical protein
MKSIRFYPGGNVRKIADERDSELYGSGSTRRASHVEPTNRVLRWIFHFIRTRVADESRAATFTRLWPCTWRARIFSGPTLGPFKNRAKAIEAEHEWLTDNWIKEGL